MLISPRPATGSIADEAAAWHADQAARWGYLPNYAALFESRPDVARAWTTLNLTVRDGMDRRRFELATIAAAREIGSTYCTIAHAKAMHDVCGDAAAVAALAGEDDSGTGALDATDRAIVAFARSVVRRPASIGTDDVAGLRAVGLTDGDIADVIFAVAARCFFATAVEAAGIRADHQLGDAFTPDVTAALTVGRPLADA